MKKAFNSIKGLEEVQVEEVKPHEKRRYIRLEKTVQVVPKFSSPPRRARFFHQPSMAGRCYVCFNIPKDDNFLTEMVGGKIQGHKRLWICQKCL